MSELVKQHEERRPKCWYAINPRHKVLNEKIIRWAAYYVGEEGIKVYRSRNGVKTTDLPNPGIQGLTILSLRADGKDFAELHHGKSGDEVYYEAPGDIILRSGPDLPEDQWEKLHKFMWHEANTRTL